MFIVVAVAPMVLDVILEATGVHESTNAVRAVTGAWFGVLLPFLIIPGAVEGISLLFTQPNPRSVQSEKGLIDA
jgi:hypothetical protein